MRLLCANSFQYNTMNLVKYLQLVVCQRFLVKTILTREQGQKILLIDKITLKIASYPTKLLTFVINNIIIGKNYGT